MHAQFFQQALFQQAHHKHVAGDVRSAEALYKQLLQLNPKHVDAEYMLGTLLAERGELDAALGHLKSVARRMPDSPMIQTNLGSVYLKLGKLKQASDCFLQSLRHNPQIPETHYNLGQLLLRQRQPAKAAGHLEKAIELKPDFLAAIRTLGSIYKELGQFDRAVVHLRKAAELQPDSVEALRELGNTLAVQQEHEQAAACFKRVVELDPSDDSARHAVAALTGEKTAAAPKEHVRNIFDDLSEKFESHLKELGYRAPELLKEMVIELAGDEVRFEKAIDLGCGTGLSAIQFRPMVGHLAGLDLSPRMVEQARAKGIYDELAEADICQYLKAAQERYDLFIATDVFAYMGDLTEIFAAVSAHASAGAYFLFSTEQTEGDDYVLRPTGRYAHSRVYVEAMAAAHGFSVAACQPTDLRLEGKTPIKADLFVLRQGN